ncbi:hypothetical protein pb186bvf_010760 [Paramecium bursaria]
MGYIQNLIYFYFFNTNSIIPMDFNTIVPPEFKCIDSRHKGSTITKIILKNENKEDQKIFESKSRMACNQCMESTMKQYRGFAADYQQLFRHWTKILESTQFENNPLQHLSHYIKEMEPDVGESEILIKISEIRNKITNLIDSIRDDLLRKVQQKEQFLKAIQKEKFFDRITQNFKLQDLNQKFGELSEKFNMTDASATKKVNYLISEYLILPIQELNGQKELVERLEKDIRDQQQISVNYQKFDYMEQELPGFLNQYKSILNEDYLTKFSYIATDYIEELFPVEPKEKILEQHRDKIHGRGEYRAQKLKQNYYQQLLGVQPFFRSGQGKLGFDHLRSTMLKLDGQQKILFLFKTNERKIGLYYNPTQLMESFLFDMDNRRKFTNYEKIKYGLDEKWLTFGQVLQITHDFKKCKSILELKDQGNIILNC